MTGALIRKGGSTCARMQTSEEGINVKTQEDAFYKPRDAYGYQKVGEKQETDFFIALKRSKYC